MSISQNFPSSRPTLNLDFARSKRLDPRIAFTRSTTATYVDEDGLIKTAPANTPRFDHNPITGECLGLLVETNRTNLATYSESFNNWTLNQITISTNAITAPDGTLTADKTNETTNNEQHLVFVNLGTISIGAKYTFSCFFKAAERSVIALTIHGAGYTVFNLTNGTISQSGGFANETITAYPNGWYRCSITVTAPTTTGAFYIVGWTTSNVYAGTTGHGVYVWGAQIENYEHGTSYIPNLSTGSTTRSADAGTITGTNFTNFYNSYEGTFLAVSRKYAFGDTARYPGIVFANDGTLSNSIGLGYIDAGADDLSFEGYISNVSQFYLNREVSVANKEYKSVGAYKVNDIAYTQNGLPITTDTSANIPTVNRLLIGVSRNGDFAEQNLNGTLSKLTYYPVRLPNSQLIELSK